MENKATRWQRLEFAVLAVLLCASSVAQGSLATLAMTDVRRKFLAGDAEPPLVLGLVFPVWSTVARWPWELGIVALYAAVLIAARRSDRARAYTNLLFLWIAVAAVFSIALWLVLQPLRLCCV